MSLIITFQMYIYELENQMKHDGNDVDIQHQLNKLVATSKLTVRFLRLH